MFVLSSNAASGLVFKVNLSAQYVIRIAENKELKSPFMVVISNRKKSR